MRVIAQDVNTEKLASLTKGFEYVVYGIHVGSDGTKFCITDDDETWPRWCPSKCFACIEPEIPADWIVLFLCSDNTEFVIGPKLMASCVHAYNDFVECKKDPCELFWKYVESQLKVSLMGESLVLYEYDTRRLSLRMERHAEGIILDSDTIESWWAPHHNKIILDEEKTLIQKRISDHLNRQGIVYGWI